ncbi:P-loop containing nucleoside triphosphate hydrolase [Pseudocohnilembus persalinus]|uniref:p-loop containing nucleoside triphosphate hydrolase n=1 Tax=Pseudocohnilembus persalinus TaxID=266149 RepID=A0A0V0QTW7_PSEPJ|nr:P-loop containing nucleoside triphosphate hydrolase [Pseudocohnilembus persalinus]|eukprot:KRX05643.1 P-loop containing nucleoside triphosphate hydrolase [Pseudocohnilembus persalinus]
MVFCQIDVTNKTKCKKKVSEENSDNKCKECPNYFCKHLVRHNCSKTQKVEENLFDKDIKKEIQEIEKKEQENKIKDFYSEQNKKQRMVLTYEPKKQDNVLSMIKCINREQYKQSKHQQLLDQYTVNRKNDELNKIKSENEQEEEKEEEQQKVNLVQEEQKQDESDEEAFGDQQINEEVDGEAHQEQQQEENEFILVKGPNGNNNINNDADKNQQSTYDAYKLQKEENKQEIDKYVWMRNQEIIKSDEVEEYAKLKKQLFDQLDKKITYKDEQYGMDFKTIKFPKKIESHYDFVSVKEEQKYKKIMPIAVRFPSQPHDIQQDLMYKIISGLDNAKGENILVEAPSGTGKTRAVLSACLSFLQKHRDINDKGYRYQILYVSNTQDQLQQVANEIKKSHVDLRCRVMASQENMCINKDVIKTNQFQRREYKEPPQFSLICQNACVQEKCKAKNNSDENIENITKQKSIIDIEEIDKMMQNFDNDKSTCPYFDLENTVDQQDVILIPYNLIFDQRQIKRLGSIQRRLLVIFDEAHNVIEEACKGSTYQLKMNTLNSVLDICQNIEKNIKKERNNIYDNFRDIKHKKISRLQYKLKDAKFQKDIKQQEHFRQLIKEAKKQTMDSQIFEYKNKITQTLHRIKEIQRLLGQTYGNFRNEQLKCHKAKSEYTKLADSYEKIIYKLFSSEENEINLIVLLKNLKEFIDYVEERIYYYDNNYLHYVPHLHDLQHFFHELLMTVREQPENYKLMVQFNEFVAGSQEKEVTFKLQCFEPRLAFRRILKFPQSHFILLSSTLTPFKTFQKEFKSIKESRGIKFQSHQFQDHIIDEKQFFCRILNINPQFNGRPVSWRCNDKKCKYNNKHDQMICQKCQKQKPSWIKINQRTLKPSGKEIKKQQKQNEKDKEKGQQNQNQNENEQNEKAVISKQGQQQFNEIGFYLENLIDKIPEGIIIVLPNMTILQQIQYAWLQGSKYGEILNKKKKLFFQPKKKKDYVEVINQYIEEIKYQKNGILLAVSNSDFLESFQIRDSLCRALFIIGKPGMEYQHGYIEEKMRYLKNNGGNEWNWYNSYSIRQINKMIGKIQNANQLHAKQQDNLQQYGIQVEQKNDESKNFTDDSEEEEDDFI